MELERMSCLKPLLAEIGSGHLPFMALLYTDSKGAQHEVPAVYVGAVDSLESSKLKALVSLISDPFSFWLSSGRSFFMCM